MNFLVLPTFYRVNNQIRAREVRLVDEKGAMLGIVPWQEATRLAVQKQLDLVEVDPKTQPPIVKLMDYGKFLYQERKLAREKSKEKRTVGELKTVRIGVGTSRHDLEVRARKIEEFLASSARVEVEMLLRGRQKAHPDFARKRLEEFLAMIPVPFLGEHEVRRTNRGFMVTVKPSKASLGTNEGVRKSTLQARERAPSALRASG